VRVVAEAVLEFFRSKEGTMSGQLPEPAATSESPRGVQATT